MAAGTVVKHPQSCRHGLRACVVAVLDNGIALDFHNLLAAFHILEALQSLPDFVQGYIQSQTHGNRSQGIVDIVQSLHRQIHGKVPPGSLDPEGNPAGLLLHIQGLHLTLVVLHSKVLDRNHRRSLATPQKGVIAV